MQIKVSIAISRGTAESDALPLLTLEVDAQPSIETLGLGLADAKAVLTQLQSFVNNRAAVVAARATTRAAVATEKVTRKTLDEADQRRLVEEALSELDFSGLSVTAKS